jgi:hypothetical protein
VRGTRWHDYEPDNNAPVAHVVLQWLAFVGFWVAVAIIAGFVLGSW